MKGKMKGKMKMVNKVILVVTLVVLFMAGGHLMDIADIVEDVSLSRGVEGYLTNGFFNVDETKIYHVGYYLMYVSFFVITLLYISILLKRDEN